jgi:monoamine oxidase
MSGSGPGSASTAVVIGAGLSGLTAAYRLRRDGWQVVVLESEPVPGGRVRSMRAGGYLFDLGGRTPADATRRAQLTRCVTEHHRGLGRAGGGQPGRLIYGP